MPRASSSSIAWLNKHPADGPPRLRYSRQIHDLGACSTAWAVRRAAVSSQGQAPPSGKRRRNRILDDPATKSEEESCTPIRSFRWQDGRNCPLYCSPHTLPAWGPKRARSALGAGGTQQIPPICGAKRARNANKWRDWTDLGEGPAWLIAERLLANDVADYVSFRAVCRSWRLCATDPRKHSILDSRFHPRQWIMLREPGATPCRPRYMNVSTGCCRSVDIPELRSHDMFPTTEGLLVLLDRTSYMVRLLNPLTRQATDLAPASTLLNQRQLNQTNITSHLLKVTGAGLADEFTFAVYFRGIRTVAVVKPGEAAQWTVVVRGNWLCPAVSFSGRFYCATYNAVMVVETSTDHPPRLAMVAKLTRSLSEVMMDSVHLVDNEGQLVLVDRQRISNSFSDYSSGNDCRKYNVYRVDLDARKMVPVDGLGGRTVFIGMERALSVSPSAFPTISSDAIYLGFDPQLIGSLDDSPIHLLDGTTEPRRIDKSSYGPWGIDDYLSRFVTGYGS